MQHLLLYRYKVLILEDSTTAAFVLQNLFQQLYPDVFEIIGVVDSVAEGLRQIAKENPDLVCLDVLLTDDEGFKLFENMHIVQFETIVTTADANHAVQAIKNNVLDFILKPVVAKEFKKAIDRFLKKKNRENILQKRIRLVSPTGIHVFRVDHLAYIEANGNNSVLHDADGNAFAISLSLLEIEKKLTVYGFYRIHKSFVVNTFFIMEYNKSEGGYVVLQPYPSLKIPVSKQVKDLILKIL